MNKCFYQSCHFQLCHCVALILDVCRSFRCTILMAFDFTAPSCIALILALCSSIYHLISALVVANYHLMRESDRLLGYSASNQAPLRLDQVL